MVSLILIKIKIKSKEVKELLFKLLSNKLEYLKLSIIIISFLTPLGVMNQNILLKN